MIYDQFLQSQEWEEFQKKLGNPTWRVMGVLVIGRALPFGFQWLYVPRADVAQAAMAEILKLGRQQQAIFVRVESATATVPAGGRAAGLMIQPRDTLVLDLRKSAEELLAQMHPKTRYNVRLAEKKGVRARFSTDRNDLEHFLRLSREVEERGQFHFHPDEYYQQMLDVMAAHDLIELAVAEHGGDVLAVHILVYFGNTVTYLHGASNSRKRSFMGPHLLQWESTKRAQARGYATYDFWGITTEKHHPWSGITRFKEGFGGRRLHYPEASDYISRPVLYWLYRLAKSIKRS